MMIENVIVSVGFLCIWLATGIPLLFIGRFLTGYANGSNKSSIIPYTSEICQPKLRKFTGTLFVVCYTSGYALMYILGVFLHWRQISIILAIWPLVSLALLFLCPESPSWLLIKGRKQDAHNALFRIRGDKHVVEREILRMQNNIKMQHASTGQTKSSSQSSTFGISRFNKGTFIRPFLVLVIMTSMGFNYTGGPTLGFYLIHILKRAKTPIDPYVAAACLVSWRVIITVAASLFLAPIFPRRKLYIISGIILATGSLLFGTLCYAEKFENYQRILESYSAIRWLPLLSIGLLYTGLSCGFVMITFCVLGELLPSNARGVGTGLVTGISVISFFAMVKFTPTMVQIIDLNGLFWIFACVGYSLVTFAYFCLPETYGKTLEDIENHYRLLCYGNQFINDRNKNTNLDVSKTIEAEKRPSVTDIYLNVTNTSSERKLSLNGDIYITHNSRRGSVISTDM